MEFLFKWDNMDDKKMRLFALNLIVLGAVAVIAGIVQGSTKTIIVGAVFVAAGAYLAYDTGKRIKAKAAADALGDAEAAVVDVDAVDVIGEDKPDETK